MKLKALDKEQAQQYKARLDEGYKGDVCFIEDLGDEWDRLKTWAMDDIGCYPKKRRILVVKHPDRSR